MFYPKGSTGYVTVEDVVTVLFELMNSEIQNERFILVSENWRYQETFSQIARIRNKKAPRIGLKKSWLKTAWLLEIILFLFGKRRFMTKALINSLCDKKKISGEKITKNIDFKYADIQEYLNKNATV
jgi:hypothetical protein